MKLSTKGRYGTRAMLDLAIHQSEEPVNVKGIAERQGVSRRYLEQLMVRLTSRGLVRPVRGRSGGFVLARSPSQITVAEVVEALEGRINIVECVEDSSICERAPLCVTREIWEEVSQAIARHLGQITLEDMAQRYRKRQEMGMAMYHI